MKTQILDQVSSFELRHFNIETLLVESAALKKNSLKDPFLRRNPVLIPRAATGPLPVVLILPHLTGNGPQLFSSRYGETNAVQLLDEALGMKKAPKALYVFVDAITSWGGSQFVNSIQGRYEDYILEELVPALHKNYDVSPLPENWCVMGGSSGGYGALHLGSKYSHVFGKVAAIAPDCFFEASLLGDVRTALPEWSQFGGPTGLLKELRSGRLSKNKNFHTIVNAVGMSLCYADGALPVDEKTGVLKPGVWKKWLQHDPLVFFPQRLARLRKLSGLYIDVGTRDQFHLQLGCRQLQTWLKSKKIRHHYSEFNGTHFDIGSRRGEVWAWLKKNWD